MAPDDNNVVLVSKNNVGSSASGELEAFRGTSGSGMLGAFFDNANQIGFANTRTLVSYNSSNTGFDLIRWRFDSSDLTLAKQDQIGDLVSGFSTRIDVTGGLVFASNGISANPFTLGALGIYVTGMSRAAVEAVP